jgi:hypothetical protein
MSSAAPIILVLEDEREIRHSMRTALESEGWQVCDAATVKQGLVEAGTRRPDHDLTSSSPTSDCPTATGSTSSAKCEPAAVSPSSMVEAPLPTPHAVRWANARHPG